MADQRIQVIERLYEAFASGDMGSVADLLADTDWHEAEGMPYGGHYSGATQIFENVFVRIANDIHGFAARPDELLPAGDDRVLALGRYTGTGKAGAPKNRLDAAFAHLWTVRDGTIVKFVQYADTHLFREAMGA